MKTNWLTILPTIMLFMFAASCYAQLPTNVNTNNYLLGSTIYTGNGTEMPIVTDLNTTSSSVSDSLKEDMAYREKVMLGLKAGLNLSNVYDAKGQQFQSNPRLGLAAGVFMTIPLGKYLGVQPELLFSQKGYQGSGSLLGSNYSYSLTTNYLDVPVMLTFKASKLIKLLFGPQYSYLISQTYLFNSALINLNQQQQFNNDNVRKSTLCMTGGVDFNFDNIVFDARVGFDLWNNNGDGTTTTPQYKNVWYQATVGYRF